MTNRQTTFAAALIAAAFALAAIGPAHVEGLKPLQGQVIDLGNVSGVVYYTVERDGFRVVATLAKKDEDAVPVRVVAVLAPDQSLTLSTPREAGTPPDAVDFIRRADTVLVHEAAAALTNKRGPLGRRRRERRRRRRSPRARDRTSSVLAILAQAHGRTEARQFVSELIAKAGNPAGG